MTLREHILGAIEDPDRRRTVAAITDVQQTHLSSRDAQDWGGEQ